MEMAEQHYAFIKNNRVQQVAVFEFKDEELADNVAHDLGYDDAVWCGDSNPALYSLYDGIEFTEPTIEYLVSIGIRDSIELLSIEEQAAEMQRRLESN